MNADPTSPACVDLPPMLASAPETFWTHKAGLRPDEYEDASAWSAAGAPPAERLHVAVADGATDGAFSGRWARILVARYVNHPRGRITAAWLRPASDEFRAGFDIAALPWYAQEKAGRGGFSALLGLTVDLRRASFQALVVGDTCLATVASSGRTEILPLPLSRLGAFGNSPYLVGSNPSLNADLPTAQVGYRRTLRPGKTSFFLMTDALAAWFVQRWHQGGRPWLELDQIVDADDFASFVARARTGGMRNDDVTLVRFKVDRRED